jgi:hypothetical protein
MKQRIRLTESDLHRIVKESVNRILRETSEKDAELAQSMRDNGITPNQYYEDSYDDMNRDYPEYEPSEEEWAEYDKEMSERKRRNKFFNYITECRTRQHDAFMLLTEAKKYAEQENLIDFRNIADRLISNAKEYYKRFMEICQG